MPDDPNVFTASWDFTRNGVGLAAVAQQAGAELLGATVYELEPGARWADLHVHYANEELIVVLAGTPTLHTLDGERELPTGAVVACPRGRRGAHRLENRSDSPARILIVSTLLMPEVVEYPEREHVFVMTEPPYSDAEYDPASGRIIRLFWRNDGLPIPPDAAEASES